MDERLARALRAEERRGKVTLQRGSLDDPPPRGETPLERLLAIWPLTLQVYMFAGKSVERLPRGEWPGEVIRPGAPA
jgi:hypothetical protein